MIVLGSARVSRIRQSDGLVASERLRHHAATNVRFVQLRKIAILLDQPPNIVHLRMANAVWLGATLSFRRNRIHPSASVGTGLNHSCKKHSSAPPEA